MLLKNKIILKMFKQKKRGMRSCAEVLGTSKGYRKRTNISGVLILVLTYVR